MKFSPLLCVVALGCSSLLSAAIVGTNPPSLPVTAERIAALPAADQPAWQRYLARSRAQEAKDKAFFAAEMEAHHLTQPLTPHEGRGGATLALDRPLAWFAGDEAKKI